MPSGKSAGKNMSARSVASLSGTTEATVSVPSVVILLVLAHLPLRHSRATKTLDVPNPCTLCHTDKPADCANMLNTVGRG